MTVKGLEPVPSYTTAKILTGLQEIAGIGLTVIGGTFAAIAFANGAAPQTYAAPVAAVAIGLTLTAAAQLTRAMIATAENTAAMLAIMQSQARHDRTSDRATDGYAAPPVRTEPRLSMK